MFFLSTSSTEIFIPQIYVSVYVLWCFRGLQTTVISKTIFCPIRTNFHPPLRMQDLRVEVLNYGQFCPLGTLAMSGDIFGCSSWSGVLLVIYCR